VGESITSRHFSKGEDDFEDLIDLTDLTDLIDLIDLIDLDLGGISKVSGNSGWPLVEAANMVDCVFLQLAPELFAVVPSSSR
jgi:hypothetical protein